MKKERQVSPYIEDKVFFYDFPSFDIILQLVMLSEPDDSYRLDQYIGWLG